MPQQPRDFLGKAEVQGVYLLGCNHRQITLYSQQTRAINLIHSLFEEGKLAEGKSVAVVGGGVAGLTAAAFAALRGCKVFVYEKEKDVLSIQAGCKNRWVHPHIYDWPEQGSLNDKTGDLPVLNWTAGTAADVIAQIKEEWYAIELHFHDRIIVTAPAEVCENAVKVRGAEVNLTDTHDAVIVAVGFGREPDRFGTPSYWQDVDLRVESGDHWLVSGFGDGAMADLMQICIAGFKHAEIKDIVSSIEWSSAFAKELLIRENSFQRPEDHWQLDAYYQSLRHTEVLQKLQGRIDFTRRITIQGIKGAFLYGPTSAIINRFIVSQIHQLYIDHHGHSADKFFTIINGEWRGEPQRNENGTYNLLIGDQPLSNVKFVVRHGPTSTLKQFYRKHWDQSEPQRLFLRDFPQQLDTTRLPMLPSPPSLVSQLHAEGKRSWRCLVVVKKRDDSLTRLAALTMPDLRDQIGDWYKRQKISNDQLFVDDSMNPSVLPILEAFQSHYSYCAAIRRLCRADVLVADVTDFDPAIMLLLGIRAAVRRSVTLVSSAMRPALRDYNSMIPFNLKELSLLDHSDVDDARILKEFKTIISRGISASASNAYQDLPAYAEVRSPNSDWPESDAIFLGAFNTPEKRGDLAELNYESLFKFLSAEIKFLSKQKVKCSRVIDDPSPRLNNQRLYEALRHADTCVVDWTYWRPNVFFEMGIRLAVHPLGAILVCAKEHTTNATETQELLLRWFRPDTYQISKANPGSEQGILKAWERYRTQNSSESTYEVVSRAVEPDEPFFTAIQKVLQQTVRNVIGRSPGDSEVRQLYADRQPRLSAEYNAAAREWLLAAWYYMENRHNPAEMTEADFRSEVGRTLAKEYVEVCEVLSEYLRTPEFQNLGKKVRAQSRKVTKMLKKTDSTSLKHGR